MSQSERNTVLSGYIRYNLAQRCHQVAPVVAWSYFFLECHLVTDLAEPERLYDRPFYSIEEVVALACESAVSLNTRSWVEAGKFFGDDVVAVKPEVIDVLIALSLEEWQFRERKYCEWADIYRVGVFEDYPDAWVKIKIERPKGKQTVMVISFHEWDDARET